MAASSRGMQLPSQNLQVRISKARSTTAFKHEISIQLISPIQTSLQGNRFQDKCTLPLYELSKCSHASRRTHDDAAKQLSCPCSKSTNMPMKISQHETTSQDQARISGVQRTRYKTSQSRASQHFTSTTQVIHDMHTIKNSTNAPKPTTMLMKFKHHPRTDHHNIWIKTSA